MFVFPRPPPPIKQPTTLAGRNIHALDPYRMPGPAAEARGAAAAQAVIDAHRAANGGAYPETVAINLWGLDAIKTKVGGTSMLTASLVGESVEECVTHSTRHTACRGELWGRLVL